MSDDHIPDRTIGPSPEVAAFEARIAHTLTARALPFLGCTPLSFHLITPSPSCHSPFFALPKPTSSLNCSPGRDMAASLA